MCYTTVILSRNYYVIRLFHGGVVARTVMKQRKCVRDVITNTMIKRDIANLIY